MASGRQVAEDKKGPHRPTTDEERRAIGTRGKIKKVSGYSEGPFWKLLERPEPNERIHRWLREHGGPVAPFFPDLDDACSRCVVGAAYVEVESYHYRNEPRLACFNKACYTTKFWQGADAYRELLEEDKKELFREDREAAQALDRGIAAMDTESLKAVATALMVRTDKFDLLHPFGEFLGGWSFESGATTRAREILGIEFKTGDRGVHYLDGAGMKALENVAPEDLRELVANLTAHHLRLTGRLSTVSQETGVEEPVATGAD